MKKEPTAEASAKYGKRRRLSLLSFRSFLKFHLCPFPWNPKKTRSAEENQRALSISRRNSTQSLLPIRKWLSPLGSCPDPLARLPFWSLNLFSPAFVLLIGSIGKMLRFFVLFLFEKEFSRCLSHAIFLLTLLFVFACGAVECGWLIYYVFVFRFISFAGVCWAKCSSIGVCYSISFLCESGWHCSCSLKGWWWVLNCYRSFYRLVDWWYILFF